jgi:hypothetical protein
MLRTASQLSAAHKVSTVARYEHARAIADAPVAVSGCSPLGRGSYGLPRHCWMTTGCTRAAGSSEGLQHAGIESSRRCTAKLS